MKPSLPVLPSQSLGSLQHLRSLLQTVWSKAILGAWVVPAALIATPTLAAERVYVSYGPLERSISVASLETYARDGKIEADLAAYAQYASPEQLQQIRELLRSHADLNKVAVSQFLYTAQGEILLERLGEIIQTDSRLSGFYAIRSALILAASDPEGLTPLNILKKFPVRSIRIDVARTLQVVGTLEQLISQTQGAIAAVEQQSAAEAAADPAVNFDQLPDIQLLGSFNSQKETITLNDRTRDRTFEADIYLPVSRSPNPRTTPAPVIVISHGLGSDRTSYAYLAEHLASYGFVVAVPEHPGSNAQQLQALVEGRASEVTEPREFVDRPLDIKYLLDELDRLSQFDPRFQGQLDLQTVGVVGQSFGGYTALALAGAEINFSRLAIDCAPNSSALNLSLLLQCRALELPQPIPNLRDERVKAVIAINPLDSSILGEEGLSQINIPVMLVSGNADTVTPALLEQIRPFTWLSTPNKYLLLMRGGTHFSTIGDSANGSEVVQLPPEVVGPDQALARRYINTMSTAFFETHLENHPAYQTYLRASYVQLLSQAPLPLKMVRFLTSAELAQAIENAPTQSEFGLTFTNLFPATPREPALGN